jgi:hypothetical protein
MTGFQDLEGQLLDAIERTGSRRRPRASLLIVVASSVMVLALAAVAIVALGHGAKPPPGHPAVAASPGRHRGQPRSTQNTYGATAQMNAVSLGNVPPGAIGSVYAALNAIQSRQPECSLGGRPSATPATISNGTPSAYMLSVLGVLRRPATAADRLPPPFYKQGRPLFPFAARQVYVRYVRLARVVNGVSYYIIPAAQVGPFPPPAALMNRCYAEEMQALRNRLGNVSSSLRAATLSAGAKVFGQIRSSRLDHRVTQGVFDLEWQGREGGGGGGVSAQTIEQQGSLGGTGSVDYGIVPSGVATVTLEWPAGGKTDAKVVGNVFVASIPGGGSDSPPPKMIWRAANGRVIKVVNTP